mmetsp:Transcript_35857/g.103040  ORF Transcript_35857/g.103040 Transcript_35857/m.103040 type:complete len:251 (-) Transcript_35857:358-1110(-)
MMAPHGGVKLGKACAERCQIAKIPSGESNKWIQATCVSPELKTTAGWLVLPQPNGHLCEPKLCSRVLDSRGCTPNPNDAWAPRCSLCNLRDSTSWSTSLLGTGCRVAVEASVQHVRLHGAGHLGLDATSLVVEFHRDLQNRDVPQLAHVGPLGEQVLLARMRELDGLRFAFGLAILVARREGDGVLQALDEQALFQREAVRQRDARLPRDRLLVRPRERCADAAATRLRWAARAEVHLAVRSHLWRTSGN